MYFLYYTTCSVPFCLVYFRSLIRLDCWVFFAARRFKCYAYVFKARRTFLITCLLFSLSLSHFITMGPTPIAIFLLFYYFFFYFSVCLYFSSCLSPCPSASPPLSNPDEPTCRTLCFPYFPSLQLEDPTSWSVALWVQSLGVQWACVSTLAPPSQEPCTFWVPLRSSWFVFPFFSMFLFLPVEAFLN